MPLRDFVNIRIAINSLGLALQGFGIPLILSANATFPDRVRFYGDTDALASDWATDSPEYLAGSAMFNQENTPQLIAIGRCVNKPTLQYAIAVTNLLPSTKYQARVIGQGLPDATVITQSTATPTPHDTHNAMLGQFNAVPSRTYTATFAPLVYTPANFTATFASSTFTQAAHGLFTGDGPVKVANAGGALPGGLNAITNYWVIKIDTNTFKLAISLADALAGTAVTITDNGTGTQTLSVGTGGVSPTAGLRLTGNAPGTWFSTELLDTSGKNTSLATDNMSIALVHADPGVTADLNAIAASDGSWYALFTLYNSAAYVNACASWVEGQNRVYIADIQDSHTITAQPASGNDVGDQLKAASFDRVLAEYHPSPIDMLGAALLGEVLPLDPGSETWAFKRLNGPRGVNLSDSQRENLRGRNMNSYEPQTPDLTWTWDGKTPGGEFLDTVRGLDSVQDDVTKSMAGSLAANPKIPYTDGGAVTLGNDLEGALSRAETAGIATPGSSVVVIPRARAQTAANRKKRNFAGFKGTFELASAIQSIDVTISVT